MGIGKAFGGNVTTIAKSVRPRKSWGKYFDSSAGFSVHLDGNSMSAFVDRRLTLGDVDGLTAYLAKEQIVARFLNCLGEEWEARSEPTDPGESGIVIYTSKGKALAAGTLKVLRNGAVSITLMTLYKGMTNQGPLEFKIKIMGNPDGTWSVIGAFGMSRGSELQH